MEKSKKENLEIETVRISEFGKALSEVYEKISNTYGKDISYESKNEKWFVISGQTKKKRKFYTRFHEDQGDIRGFSVSYGSEYAVLVDRIVVAMANSFEPWAVAPIPPKAPDLSMPNEPQNSGGESKSLPEIAAVTPKTSSPPTRENTPSASDSNPSPTAAEADTQSGSASTAANSAPPPLTAEPVLASTGTGFVVSQNWLLTNAHVVDGCKKVAAKPIGEATRIISDGSNDLALLEFKDQTLPSPLAFSGSQLALGESIIALGYPLRSVLAESLNVTVGNVSSLAGIGNDSRYLQMTAAVQPGNSGGPLMNLRGAIVGVVSAKLDAIKMASQTGDIPQSVNFAIKHNAAKTFMESNGIEFRVSGPESAEKTVTQVTESAKKSVFPIDCLK